MARTGEYYAAAVVFVVTFVITYLLVRLRRSKLPERRYPPCLPHLPVIGSILFLPHVSKLHHYLREKAMKLGNVFSLYLADQYTVVLNGRDAIHEAFVKHPFDFANRPSFHAISYYNPNFDGIIWHPYNAKFKKFHQLSLSILKKFGFGKGIMEKRIHVEVDDLISQFGEFDGAAFDPTALVTSCVFNVTSSIIFGKRFEHSDSQLKAIIDSVQGAVRQTADPVAISYFPFLRFLPKYKRSLQNLFRIQDDQFALLNDRINKSLSGETDESFTSCFVQEEGPEYDRRQLLFILKDLLVAGTETTSTTIQWMLVYLANHPEAQSHMQKVLDSIVPRSRLPSLEDKPNLVIVEAFLLELMRIKTLLPLSLQHMTLCDTEVGGYFIPANTWVIANLYSAHMDPVVWPEPEKFRPERFIDESGLLINKDLVISFSLGKRSCLGELLARQELFLFFSGLLQQFDVRPPEGQQRIDCPEVVGITVAPSPYKVRLIKRM